MGCGSALRLPRNDGKGMMAIGAAYIIGFMIGPTLGMMGRWLRVKPACARAWLKSA